jgi:hypothetical protein
VERCGHRHEGKVCVRAKDHPGVHWEEGRKIEGGFPDGVQARRYKVWKTDRDLDTTTETEEDRGQV